ncbi:MAG: hypothetical protein A3F11_07770 [Gammaproteobacteria bacterium RIFCSPHIGHO2_12_FULL_37_14]|nr:MAG: hypothetical protein A3F11_07770 [Gammaproteobacteria bacterium RIFCSPHIGHO2_12_FULL_37_14]
MRARDKNQNNKLVQIQGWDSITSTFNDKIKDGILELYLFVPMCVYSVENKISNQQLAAFARELPDYVKSFLMENTCSFKVFFFENEKNPEAVETWRLNNQESIRMLGDDAIRVPEWRKNNRLRGEFFQRYINFIENLSIDEQALKYDFDLISDIDTERRLGTIYLKATTAGLQYEVIKPDEKDSKKMLKVNTISWDKLSDFPRNSLDIVQSKEKYLLDLLKHTSKAGHTLGLNEAEEAINQDVDEYLNRANSDSRRALPGFQETTREEAREHVIAETVDTLMQASPKDSLRLTIVLHPERLHRAVYHGMRHLDELGFVKGSLAYQKIKFKEVAVKEVTLKEKPQQFEKDSTKVFFDILFTRAEEANKAKDSVKIGFYMDMAAGVLSRLEEKNGLNEKKPKSIEEESKLKESTGWILEKFSKHNNNKPSIPMGNVVSVKNMPDRLTPAVIPQDLNRQDISESLPSPQSPDITTRSSLSP